MIEVLTFILLGLGVGGGYALAAQGMVLVYRGSGVINLSHGAVAGIGAFSYYELTHRTGMHPLLAVILATLFSALVGLFIHGAVMRPLRNASGLIRLIATTGVLTILSQILTLRYGSNLVLMENLFSPNPVRFTKSLVVAENRIWLFGVAVVVTIVLTLIYRYTRIGVATAAMAEREEVVAAHGWRPGRLAALNWMVGCGLAGLAGALLGPIVDLTPTTATLLVIPLLAAAMLGRFRSFPLAFAGGLVIGIGESLLTRYVSQPGWGDALPFLIVVAILVFKGSSLPLRSHLLERLPRVGDPRMRIRTIVLLGLIGVILAQLLHGQWADSTTTTFSFATIALSVVVITGYAGQLSLAQYAMAGLGGLVASRVVATTGVSFWLGLLAAVAASIPLGLIIGLPAVRTRGVNLAIATLALAIVVQEIVLGNASLTGGVAGTTVPPPSIFGLSLDPINHPQRYAGLCIACFVVCGIFVRNVRRGPAGRRMIAVRSNERAAASMGINVTTVKLTAFVLGACVAAVGGTLTAFQNPNVEFANFTALNSIQIVVFVVIGGIGFASASLQGALMSAGGLVIVALSDLIPLGNYVLLIGGVSVILVLIQNPDGAIPPALAVLKRLRPARPKAPPRQLVIGHRPIHVVPKRLEVSGLGVRIGGVQALDDVGFNVEPGEIVGLIGPNGAGKTTCIDIISGFTSGQGRVVLGGLDITNGAPEQRARAGLGRSFQSLEMFEDVTLWDNLATASEMTRSRSWGLDFLRPRPAELSEAAVVAARVFGLEDHLDEYPNELPTGTRRVAAIARSLAAAPSILLLDEPAAGLDEGESGELGALLKRVAHDWGVGVLLVDHDVELVMGICDRIVVLDRGCKIAAGIPSVIACDLAVIDAYLGSPVVTKADDLQGAEVGRVAG